MSDQNRSNELNHAAKLDTKRRGELAELAFMRKAASLGLAVAKPWGDSDRYDVVVRFESTFWRVQIKSVLDKSPSRDYYRVQTRDSRKHTYSARDIDFLVAYVFAEDTWYVFPAHMVENKKSVCLSPGSKRARAEKYRDAWKLMMMTRSPADAAVPQSKPTDTEEAKTYERHRLWRHLILRATLPRKIATTHARTTSVPLANAANV